MDKKEFENCLKAAVESAKKRYSLKLDVSEDSDDWGTTVRVSYNHAEFGNVNFLFGKYTPKEKGCIHNIYVWFYVDSWEDVRKDEREAERVPDEIKYRLENIDAESVPAHCKYLSRITNQKGDIWFWLKDEYYNDICSCKNYSVCLSILTNFFNEVMDCCKNGTFYSAGIF